MALSLAQARTRFDMNRCRWRVTHLSHSNCFTLVYLSTLPNRRWSKFDRLWAFCCRVLWRCGGDNLQQLKIITMKTTWYFVNACVVFVIMIGAMCSAKARAHDHIHCWRFIFMIVAARSSHRHTHSVYNTCDSGNESIVGDHRESVSVVVEKPESILAWSWASTEN